MYLNLIQLAESFGVSEKVVLGWVRDEGLPQTPDRGRVLFDRAQVADWAAKRGLAAQAGFLAPQATALTPQLHLGPLLRMGGIWRDVPATGVAAVFERIVNALPGTTPPVRKLLGQRVRAEGGVTMAPIGGGFALPHPGTRITLGRDSGLVALILLRDALPPAEPVVDELPVKRLLFFIAPSPRAHLELIGRLSRLLSQKPLRELLSQGATDDEIYQAFNVFDTTSAGPFKPEVKS